MPYQRYGNVTHCIFDNDGLLMDTENLYSEAIQAVLSQFNITFTFDVKLRLMGLNSQALAKLLIDEYNLPLSPDEYIKQQEAHVMRLMDHTHLMPGAVQLLMHLHEHKIPMAIATSSARKMFDIKSRAHRNLLPMFHHIVCGCDPEVKNSKPAPDIYLVAASRFKPKPAPNCCLVFEDSPNGMQAGRRAGMQVVMVPDSRVPSYMKKGATVVISTLQQFEPEDFGLPPFETCSRFEFGYITFEIISKALGRNMQTHKLFRPVTHCIFDMDGLLIDSERLITESVQQIISPFGHTYTFEVKMHCMGMHRPEMADFVIHTYNLPLSVAEFERQHVENCERLLENVPLLPGVERLVRHLHDCQVPICVATSSTSASYALKTKPHTKLFKVFHHVVTGGSDPAVLHGKPAPDVFLLAASRFNERPKPHSCLVFEDSPNGMYGALAAGMQVILVPDPRLPLELREPATQCLSSLEYFQPQYFGLPRL